jgi:hypothetical protein
MASKDPGFDLIQARHFCCSIHDSLKEQMYMLGKLAMQYEEQILCSVLVQQARKCARA